MRYLVLMALLFGCAAPRTKEGDTVRQIRPEGATPCKFLRVVEVSGGLLYSSETEAHRDMLNKLRNETARLGGNAYVITSTVVQHGFSLPFAQADAYLCPPT
jgi:hypothetical protein